MTDAQRWSRRRLLRLVTIGSSTLLTLTACAQPGRGSVTPSSATTTTSSERQNASASNRTRTAVHSTARSATPLTFMQTFKPSERDRLDSLFLPDVKRDLPQIALAIIPQKPSYTD